MTTLDGQGSGPVIVFINAEELDSVLEGFTIANGSAEVGAGARIIDASASFIDCHFTDNVADIGGAIYENSPEGELNLLRCVFDGNQALVATGAVFVGSGGALIAVDCVFTDNDGGQPAWS